MADFNYDGLKAAARSLANTMKRVAAVKTRRGADAVNVSMGSDVAIIRAGEPGGPWGWEPIVASMFEDNRRHPFFGNKNKWYPQGHYPITEITVREGADTACDAYVENAIDPLLREHGFK